MLHGDPGQCELLLSGFRLATAEQAWSQSARGPFVEDMRIERVAERDRRHFNFRFSIPFAIWREGPDELRPGGSQSAYFFFGISQSSSSRDGASFCCSSILLCSSGMT